MLESRPPGVFISIKTNSDLVLSASSMVLTMYSAVIGCMGAWTVIFKIEAPVEEKIMQIDTRRRNNLLATVIEL